MTTQQELIDLAKSYVRDGAALSVHMPTDDTDDPGQACEAMFLSASSFRYIWLWDSHTHIFGVRLIEAADDGAVLVHVDNDGMVMRIGRGTDQMVQRLTVWRKRVDGGEAALWLEGGLVGAVVFGG